MAKAKRQISKRRKKIIPKSIRKISTSLVSSNKASSEASSESDKKNILLNNNKDDNLMEVHHHPHHTHEKKKIKDYLWEFLMLFLAVLCGSLAEYKLEHVIESDREKAYIKSMYEDLKSDTAIFSTYARNTAEFENTVDTLISLLKSSNKQTYIRHSYFLARMATIRGNPATIYPDKRTYNQMSYSGTLRLIHKEKVLNAMTDYYLSLGSIENQNEAILNRISDYMRLMGEIFDAEILFNVWKERKKPENENLRFLTKDEIAINQLLTALQYLNGTRAYQSGEAVRALPKAIQLMKILQDEYHLQN